MRVALKVEGFLMLLVRRDGFRCQTDQLGQAQSSIRQRGKSLIVGHAVTILYLLLNVLPILVRYSEPIFPLVPSCQRCYG
jgi:hypothetical protein